MSSDNRMSTSSSSADVMTALQLSAQDMQMRISQEGHRHSAEQRELNKALSISVSDSWKDDSRNGDVDA